MSNIIGRVVVVVILLFLGALADAVRLGGPDDPDHFRSSSKFNCSDPRGLPCKEVYALLDVINGLQLPDTTSINSRQKCNVTTKSISITCSCTLLEGIQVCHVTQITTNALDLSDGIIHENVSFLPYLEHLDLAVNGLHCNIPHSLGSLKALKKLYLYNNFLRGPIPQSLGNLASLEFLDLSRNMLSGEIPKELGKLGNLISMNLEENQLVGNLPREFGDLIKLQTLDLGSNYLNGVLPDTFHNISSIQEFDIGGNNFHGRIPNFFSKWINLTTLDLRGNEFEGSLPSEIFQMSNLESLYVSDLNNTREPLVIPSESNLTTLDLSFNNLNGSIPNALRNVSEIVLTGNMLSGQIPAWINEKSESTDISYNDLPMPHNRTIPANISPNRNYTTDAKKRQCDSLDYKLFINCGGEKQSYEDKEYEQDTSMERFYESPKKKWGYTCSGNFQSESIESMNSSNYIKNKTCGVTDAGLQETARLCPVSLTYYAFCLHNGNYLVKLQFAEIVFAMDQDYSSRGKRVFDVYIQVREKKLKNFNIKKESGGEVNKANNKEFVGNVHDNQLVIHFYWAGKGSLSNSALLNGPLVSAISITPNFTISGEKKLSAGQITGITLGSTLVPILVLAFLWKMGLLGNREFKKVQIDVKGSNFTLQQIIDATRNFSPTMEIGKGRFGVVYKAELAEKIILAVKKISPDLMQDKLKTELYGEIYNLKSLKQENLIELYDGYSKKDLHLLIYEYMEKGSLHQAVLDPNPTVVLDWKVRFDICLGLAKALKYLHEETGQTILHRNIKASNILLDGTYNPKLSDFGWARLYNEEDPFMTIKAGAARVYIAPEYALGQAITAKADVYSYGVVVLEVFSGRPSIDYKPNQEAAYLLDDGRMAHAQKRMDKLVDRKMENYDRKVVLNTLNLAIMCILPTANLRPTMSEVVSVLLHESTLDHISKAHLS